MTIFTLIVTQGHQGHTYTYNCSSLGKKKKWETLKQQQNKQNYIYVKNLDPLIFMYKDAKQIKKKNCD